MYNDRCDKLIMCELKRVTIYLFLFATLLISYIFQSVKYVFFKSSPLIYTRVIKSSCAGVTINFNEHCAALVQSVLFQ